MSFKCLCGLSSLFFVSMELENFSTFKGPTLCQIHFSTNNLWLYPVSELSRNVPRSPSFPFFTPLFGADKPYVMSQSTLILPPGH